jgi:hypothetical protein
MNTFLLIIALIIASDMFFDFFFSRTGRKIYSVISDKTIQDAEYERKRFVLRIIGAVFWLSIYAVFYLVFKQLS